MIKKFSTLLLVSMATVGLTACDRSQPVVVECKGIPTTTGQILISDKPTCGKLAGGKPIIVQCGQWMLNDKKVYTCTDTAVKITLPDYSPNDYVKCYGVAAASMNDCGTPTTACGGSVSTPKSSTAWIAIPGGICSQIKGATLKENH